MDQCSLRARDGRVILRRGSTTLENVSLVNTRREMLANSYRGYSSAVERG